MIKVIKYGYRKTTCPKCNAVLMYEETDVIFEDLGRNEVRTVIVCPVCEEKIEVSYFKTNGGLSRSS